MLTETWTDILNQCPHSAWPFFVFKNFFGNVVAIRNVKVNCYKFIIAYLQRKSMGVVVSGFLLLSVKHYCTITFLPFIEYVRRIFNVYYLTIRFGQWFYYSVYLFLKFFCVCRIYWLGNFQWIHVCSFGWIRLFIFVGI